MGARLKAGRPIESYCNKALGGGDSAGGGGGGGEKLSDSGYILKVEPKGLPDMKPRRHE